MSKVNWWQKAIFYEIVPHSFQDSDGDGFGDLQGICTRLDYLEWLGIDAIWLGPPYVSPMADFGYDIVDHCAIDPAFGTMAEFERFVSGAHERGIRVVLDFVPNHTSHQHPWFLESRSSKQNPKRDWYLWRQGSGGRPPNNWMSIFGGSAWSFDETTGEYYLHTFTPQEPDLNWRNPEVRNAMIEILRFWMERGIDGFRIDACWYVIKDDLLRDNPPNPKWDGIRDHERISPAFSEDQPEVHEVLREMRRLIDSEQDRVLIGEMYLPPKQMATYFGSAGDEIHLPSNFGLGTTTWTPEVVAHAIAEYEATIPASAWPNWVIGNHDMSRVASRSSPQLAPVIAMLQMTLRGSLFIYYGEEIGMEDVQEAAALQVDPQLKDFKEGNRMPFRTPMQWDATPGTGFTTGKPWLPIPESASRVNVESEKQNPGSILNLYRRLIRLRREQPALVAGAYIPLPIQGSVVAYLRQSNSESLLVILNFGATAVRYTPDPGIPHGRILLGMNPELAGTPIYGDVELRAYDGIVAKLK